MPVTIPNTLTVAGSDSGGGAGIQADIKTLSALGTFATSVLTALTAQNTREVRGILDLPPEFIEQQFDTVCEDIAIAAVKIGMLSRPVVIEIVANCLDRHQLENIVLDPVMIAKSGDHLLQTDAIDALKRKLLPRATIITPNLPEAAVLLDKPEAKDADAMADDGLRLLELGAQAVLMKGGHASGPDNTDVLVTKDGEMRFVHPHIDTLNTHGTGCTLSSAITAGLALGLDLNTAVENATDYVHGAIAEANDLSVGEGHGPVHHFHELWRRRR